MIMLKANSTPVKPADSQINSLTGGGRKAVTRALTITNR